MQNSNKKNPMEGSDTGNAPILKSSPQNQLGSTPSHRAGSANIEPITK